jgi:hypothetical protein
MYNYWQTLLIVAYGVKEERTITDLSAVYSINKSKSKSVRAMEALRIARI